MKEKFYAFNLLILQMLCRGNIKKKKIMLLLQVDLCAEEMGNNVRPAVALLGDISAIVTQVMRL